MTKTTHKKQKVLHHRGKRALTLHRGKDNNGFKIDEVS
jgi:hypothetical protein